MEKYMLSDDIRVLCVTAKSFPDGVLQAHQNLHSLVPFSNEKRYFGISRPDKDTIVYKAAAEETYYGETKKLGCESFVIKSGQYISIFILNFMKDVQEIGKAFQKLILHPAIDQNGFCIEWYLNDQDVRCMVRLDPEKILSAEAEAEFNSTFENFYKLISSLTEKLINTVPFEGSWTAGQLARHVFKSYTGFVQAINGPVKHTDRDPNELNEKSKFLLLDLDTKMKASALTTPEEIHYNKEKLLNSLEDIHNKLVESTHKLDMSMTCTLFEIPTFGYLTRLEAVYFVMYHTQRHTQQLKNIIEKLNTKG